MSHRGDTMPPNAQRVALRFAERFRSFVKANESAPLDTTLCSTLERDLGALSTLVFKEGKTTELSRCVVYVFKGASFLKGDGTAALEAYVAFSCVHPGTQLPTSYTVTLTTASQT